MPCPSRITRVVFCAAALGFALGGSASGQIGFAVTSDEESSDPEDNLFSINLATGVATAIGLTGFDDLEGLAFHPFSGVLFGVDDATEALVTCSTATGACVSVGSLGTDESDPGLAFSCDGTLYMSTEDDPGNLYTVDTSNGTATLVGSFGSSADGHSIAFGPATAGCPSGAFILNGNVDEPDLYCVNLANGAATLVGSLGTEIDGQPAMDFDQSGVLWVVEDDAGLDLYRVNTTTGLAVEEANNLTGGGFDSLAIQSGFCAAQSVLEIPTASAGGLAGLVLLVSALGVRALRRRGRP